MLDHDLGHLWLGRRIQISGHSDFGILHNDGASSFLTWCKLTLRPLLVLRVLEALFLYPLLAKPSFVFFFSFML